MTGVAIPLRVCIEMRSRDSLDERDGLPSPYGCVLRFIEGDDVVGRCVVAVPLRVCIEIGHVLSVYCDPKVAVPLRVCIEIAASDSPVFSGLHNTQNANLLS